MISNLAFSLNAVSPIFIVMLFGVLIKKKGLLSQVAIKQMNDIVFKFALPAKLFLDLYSGKGTKVMDTGLMAFAVLATLFSFFSAWAVAIRFLDEDKQRGAFVQGCFRSNYAIIGLPLITNILGRSPSEAAVITVAVIPLYNVLSVVVLSAYGEKKGSRIKSALLSIVKNPLIIGVLLGIIFSSFEIPIPSFALSSMKYLGDLSAPLALIAIGGSLNFSEVRGRIKPTALAVLIKLILTPVVLLGAAFAWGLSNTAIAVLFVLFAAPTALSSYVMADNMGSDSHLASNIILATSILSIFTYTIGVYILRIMGIV